MDVPVKSSNGITLMSLESRLLMERKIFIEGEINAETARDFHKKILYLNSEDSERAINVFIDSQGGEIGAGLSMYDIIQLSKAPVRMFCTCRAHSMAAILFACGTYGRFMLPSSTMMLHEPRFVASITGDASSIKSISDSLFDTKRKINQILAKHSGKSLKEIEEASSFDHYFTAEESIEFGLCDKILSDFNIMMTLEG